MSLFIRPIFDCPFSTHLNPNREVCWERTHRWLHEMELARGDEVHQQLDKSGFSELAAKAYPNADAYGLEVAMYWIVWLFISDDQLDENYRRNQRDESLSMMDRLRTIVRYTVFPNSNISLDTNIEIAFADLWRRTAASLTSRQRERFRKTIWDYFGSVIYWEVENRMIEHVHSPLTYAEIRRETGAVKVCFDLIERNLHAEIPGELEQSSVLTTLRNCAVDVVSFSNDIFSFAKEYECNQQNNNILTLASYYKCGIQGAIDQVFELQSERQAYFIKTRNRLPAFFDFLQLPIGDRKITERYVDGLEHWMRANVDFSLKCPRYSYVK